MERDSLYSRELALCVAANAAQSVAYSLFLHFPGFLKKLGAGETRIGVLMALTALSAVALGPAFGRLMDQRGRRGVILAGNALNVVVLVLYLFFDSIHPLLYAVRLLHGMSEMMLYSSLFTYASDLVPRSRSVEGLGLFGAATMLSIAAGGALGEAAIAYGGYTALFATALFWAVVALLLALPLTESHRPPATPQEAPRRWRATLLQADLVPLWLAAWIFFFAMAAVWTFFKTFVMETELGTLGGFFAVYMLVAIVLRIFLGWVPDRVGPQRVAAPALFVYGAGVVLLAGAGSVGRVYVAAALCGLGHGYGFPALLSLVSGRARPSEKGSAMAIYTTLDEAAVLAAGPFLGWVIDHQGYPVMYALAGGALVGASVLFALLSLRRREKARGFESRGP